MKKFFFVLMVMFLTTFFRGEKFYKYINSNGEVVYCNRKPKNVSSKKVKVYEIKREREDLLQFDDDRYNRYDPIIRKYSKKYGVDFNLIKTVILVESNFNPSAVSPKGAIGLMQLLPDTAIRFGVDDPYDPDQNIMGGTKYLKYLIKMFNGDLRLVLSAYNAGENLVKRINRVPNYRETKKYVNKIIEVYGSDMVPVDVNYVYRRRKKFYKYYDENGTLVLTNIAPSKDAKIIN